MYKYTNIKVDLSTLTCSPPIASIGLSESKIVTSPALRQAPSPIIQRKDQSESSAQHQRDSRPRISVSSRELSIQTQHFRSEESRKSEFDMLARTSDIFQAPSSEGGLSSTAPFSLHPAHPTATTNSESPTLATSKASILSPTAPEFIPSIQTSRHFPPPSSPAQESTLSPTAPVFIPRNSNNAISATRNIPYMFSGSVTNTNPNAHPTTTGITNLSNDLSSSMTNTSTNINISTETSTGNNTSGEEPSLDVESSEVRQSQRQRQGQGRRDQNDIMEQIRLARQTEMDVRRKWFEEGEGRESEDGVGGGVWR